jgi:hypothetical protein
MKFSNVLGTKLVKISFLSLITGLTACIVLSKFFVESPLLASSPPARTWSRLPVLKLRGGLKVFWHIGDNSRGQNDRAALVNGFSLISGVNTYVDYPGNQKENVYSFLGENNSNPWRKPAFFERTNRRSIADTGSPGAFLVDIEFAYEENIERAWNNPAARTASRAKSLAEFRRTYFREWASWFWLPLLWAKQKYPKSQIGLYGVQPFRRDYWGISGKTAAQIDGSHATDIELWQHIEPYVDFYVASIYVFYDNPDSVFYMAANVEENFVRTRRFGNKPVFAYTWLRYHDSNAKLKGQELAPYLVEAMAIVPFFSGSKNVVLWGYEPQLRAGDPLPYDRLELFMKSLKRLEPISEKLGQAKLLIDKTAAAAWREQRPLIRRALVTNNECIVMAINPWQQETAKMTVSVRCGDREYPITMVGKRVSILHIYRNQTTVL